MRLIESRTQEAFDKNVKEMIANGYTRKKALEKARIIQNKYLIEEDEIVNDEELSLYDKIKLQLDQALSGWQYGIVTQNNGFIPYKGKSNRDLKNLQKKYFFRDIPTIISSKMGIDWDIVELIRYILRNNGLESKSLVIIPREDFFKTAIYTIIDNKFICFKYGNFDSLGIVKFDSYDQMINHLTRNQLTTKVKEYYPPKYGTNFEGMIKLFQ